MKTLQLFTSLYIALQLVGCGDDSGAGSSKENLTAKNEETDFIQSIALKSKEDLPECTETNDTQLAYIKDEKLFYVCENLEWVEADVKGKDGNDGQDGSDGSDGVDGTNASNTWEDVLTGKIWRIGGNGGWGGQSCGSDYHAPDTTEADLAMAHGIFVVSSTISGPNTMWTTMESGANATYIDSAGTQFQTAKSASKGLFCVSN